MKGKAVTYISYKPLYVIILVYICMYCILCIQYTYKTNVYKYAFTQNVALVNI